MLFSSLSGVMWPLLGPLDKTKLVIEFGRVPFLLCLMVKVELEKEKKTDALLCPICVPSQRGTV